MGKVAAPTALKLLRGERHSSRINQDEPVPRDTLPIIPPGQPGEVVEVWDYTVSVLGHMRLAAEADRDALLIYCRNVIAFREAAKAVDEDGILVMGSLGTKIRNPALAAMRDAGNVVRSFAQEFGLTPSARGKINATLAAGKPTDQADNPYADAVGE